MERLTDFEPPSTPPPFLQQEQVRQLCQQGHLALNLPPRLARLFDSLFEESYAFFDLPLDRKSAIYPSVQGNTEQGYTLVPSEKEFITLRYLPEANGEGSQDAVGPPATNLLEDVVAEAWHDTVQLLRRILVDISAYLSISPTAWETLIADSLALPRKKEGASPTLMRLFQYQPRGGIAEPHRDLGLLTVCVCRGRGLQVWQHEEQTASEEGSKSAAAPRSTPWREAAEVTLLVGHTLRVLSGNRIPAAVHRVEATDDGRHSIVFALRPSTRPNIDLASFGGEGVIGARALWEAIRVGRVNVNLQKSERDEIRARIKAERESIA